jgi:hypothetical protein
MDGNVFAAQGGGMEKKMKKAEKIISIVFFALAGISLVYGVWSIVFFVKDLSGAIDSGQFLLSGNEYTVVNYLVTGSIQYIFLAALLFGFGWFFFHRSSAALAADAPADADGQTAEGDLNEVFGEGDEESGEGDKESSEGDKVSSESDEDAGEGGEDDDKSSGDDKSSEGGEGKSGEDDAKIDLAKKDA